MATLGFQRLKVVALAAEDMARAGRFYGETLGLPPAFIRERQAGYKLGDTVLMLKSYGEGWYAQPSPNLNPRLTIEVDNARDTERELRGRGVAISDPVQAYEDDGADVGAFTDSEGNKLWFCSPIDAGKAKAA